VVCSVMPSKKNKSKGDGGSAPATPRSEPAAGGAADANTEAEMEEDEEEVATGNKRDGADISKVTDYVEQKELDSAKATKAIASIVTELEVDREAERERERELAAVVIEQARAIHTSPSSRPPAAH
jgi:hypothetical protein